VEIDNSMVYSVGPHFFLTVCALLATTKNRWLSPLLPSKPLWLLCWLSYPGSWMSVVQVECQVPNTLVKELVNPVASAPFRF
jgi:hypothetical protein